MESAKRDFYVQFIRQPQAKVDVLYFVMYVGQVEIGVSTARRRAGCEQIFSWSRHRLDDGINLAAGVCCLHHETWGPILEVP